MFPWSSASSLNLPSENSRVEAVTLSATVETLNSKKLNVTAQNSNEKPVFDGNFTANHRSKRNMESKKSAPDRTDDEYTSPSKRQLTVPFLAVPANWVATFNPSNAVIFANRVPLRIWAVGNIAKFPTFFENIVQRIQSYYSTYKYQDLSRPVSHAIINPQYHQHEVTNIQTMIDNGETEQLDGIDLTEMDPINDGDSIEYDTETASTVDYFDSTTESNYHDDDDVDDDTNDETTAIDDSIEVFK